MKTKIQYTRRELSDFAKSAALSLLTGFLHLMWAVVLLAVNLALWGWETTTSAIRAAPVVAFGMATGVMAVATLAVYMQMKTRLTTAEWQRDSIEMRLDSVCEEYNIKATYTRTIPLRHNEALP